MKRAAIVGIAVAGAVIVAGGGLAWWIFSRGQSAEDAARSYLSALAAGDLDAVQAMREPLPDGQEEILAQAFLGASAHIADPRIEGMDEHADGVVGIRASAELAGERRDLRFSIQADGSGWILGGDHTGTLTVDGTIADAALEWVAVGGAVAPAATSLALLPAEYLVAAAPAGILEGSAEAAVGTGTPMSVSLTATLARDASDRVQEQLDAYADTCAEPATSVPDHCGIVVPWAADFASLERIAFRIEQHPAVTLTPDARSFDATAGVLVATAEGVTRAGGAASVTYRADDWALRGTVLLEGDRVVLSVR
ncbi:hypothetical protein [Microbacterium sp. CPCC 204701]|uniref:hypothetical protein n=1 Tax=Microbacterium sp. CPCC 204701 TaxID=2493084 RepID=UPI000FDA8099|nr:hypothetical protein [Microbacterium sp. CPCC 204701]